MDFLVCWSCGRFDVGYEVFLVLAIVDEATKVPKGTRTIEMK